MRLILGLVLASMVTAAVADEPVVVKDTRVFSCGSGKGSTRACGDGETPLAISGELVLRRSSNFCERHAYRVVGGDVLQSKDGQAHIQFPAQVDRLVMFKCDEQGGAL